MKTNKSTQIKICKEYKNGITNKELCKKYQLHRTTIQRILKKNGVVLKKLSETSRKHKILNFNKGIKNGIDAYIFGLIMADGNLCRNCIDITLHIKDKQILSEISNYVYGYEQLSYRPEKVFTQNGKSYKTSKQCRFIITSKDVVKKLKPLGLIENKSLIIRYPKISKMYDKDFIRGFFDGDGSICIPEIKHNVRVSFVSNHKFCEDLKDILQQYLDVNIHIHKKTETVSSVNIYGKQQVLTFCNWLYDDAKIKMNRKYQKYISLL